MKILISILLFLALLSCTSKQAKYENTTLHDTIETFPIETIKKVCFERRNHYNLASLKLSDFKVIDSTFFKKWFDKRKVDNLKNINIKFDQYSRYYFFDYKEVDKLFLFSIINNDEIGYNILYHFVFDKNKKEIIRTELTAETGGDGGEVNVDILDYNSRGDKLRLTSISTYNEVFDENKPETRQYDSTIMAIEFNDKKTNYKRIMTFSKLDTLGIK
jgi:hypothetical protein